MIPPILSRKRAEMLLGPPRIWDARLQHALPRSWSNIQPVGVEFVKSGEEAEEEEDTDLPRRRYVNVPSTPWETLMYTVHRRFSGPPTPTSPDVRASPTLATTSADLSPALRVSVLICMPIRTQAHPLDEISGTFRPTFKEKELPPMLLGVTSVHVPWSPASEDHNTSGGQG